MTDATKDLIVFVLTPDANSQPISVLINTSPPLLVAVIFRASSQPISLLRIVAASGGGRAAEAG